MRSGWEDFGVTDDYGYLQRLEERRRGDALKRQIVLGLVLGWLCILIGGFRLLFVVGTDAIGWKIVLGMGFLLVCLSLALPSLLSVVERWWTLGTNGLGWLVFSGLLMIIYFVMVWPAGVLLRWLEGQQGFFKWKESRPSLSSVWEPYVPRDDKAEQAVGTTPLLFQPARMLVFFARRGQYLFLPALLFLLLLGLALFFVQTSSLAPFIYTLF